MKDNDYACDDDEVCEFKGDEIEQGMCRNRNFEDDGMERFVYKGSTIVGSAAAIQKLRELVAASEKRVETDFVDESLFEKKVEPEPEFRIELEAPPKVEKKVKRPRRKDLSRAEIPEIVKEVEQPKKKTVDIKALQEQIEKCLGLSP